MMTLYSIKVVVFKESSFRKYLVLIKLEKTKLHLQSLFFLYTTRRAWICFNIIKTRLICQKKTMNAGRNKRRCKESVEYYLEEFLCIFAPAFKRNRILWWISSNFSCRAHSHNIIIALIQSDFNAEIHRVL